MPERDRTCVSPLQVRNKEVSYQSDINWENVERRSRGEAFLKNLAVSAALVLCVVTLRAGTLPSLAGATDAVLTAVTDQSLLDDQLGKLSFVSALFPEAVLVFGEDKQNTLNLAIASEDVIHAWSVQEPYTAWHVDDGRVFSPCDGEVIGVYHGNGDERLVQVMSADGISCLFGNLQTVCVEIGEAVNAGTMLGVLQHGEACVLEIRDNGTSVDPASYMSV